MLGRTVGELLDTISYPELLQWRDFLQIEPEPEWRADARAANICSTIANVNRDPKKKSEPFQPKDFMMFEFEDMVRRIKEKEAEKAAVVEGVEAPSDGGGARIAPETLRFLFAASRQKALR